MSCRIRDLILKPQSVWTSIGQEQSSVREVYLRFTVWVLILPWVSWLIGKCFVGEHVLFAGVVRWPFLRGFFVALLLYLISMLLIYGVSWIAKGLAAAMRFELPLLRACQLVSYSLVPAMISGLLLALPGLEGVWGLLSLYGAFLLYEGAASLALVPADKRVPFFVGMIFSALISFGLLSVIVGRFTPPILPKILEQTIGHV